MYQDQIRVGTIKYVKGKKIIPRLENYKTIEVMTPSTPYGDISPYTLKDENGRFMENIWQFSKVYETVPKTTQRYSRFDSTIIWDHPKEKHVIDHKPTKEYWDWRDKGMNNKFAVRYPVGYNIKHRSSCLYSLKETDSKPLNYVEARKQIYLPVYADLVRKTKKYKKLVGMLEKGKNLLIVEVDGPQYSSLEYYKDKYGVSNTFIENSSMQATRENLEIMLNDTKHPFGHGYCLAHTLLE